MRAPKKSKTYGLFKSCQHLWDKCDCPWLGRYKHVRYINLGEWAGIPSIGKKRAVEVLAEVKVAIRENRFTPKRPPKAEGMTFKAFIALYRTYVVEDRGIPDTKTSAMHTFLRVWERELGDLPLEAVTTATLEEWLKARAKAKAWSNNTWNHWRSSGLSMFKWAMKPKVGLATVNPFEGIDLKQVEVKPQPRFDDLGVDEATLLAAVAKAYPECPETPMRHALHANKRQEMERRIVGALDMGVRLTELADIQVHHINFTTWEVRLPSSKGKTKTGVEERVFAMTPRLQAILTERATLGPFSFVFGHQDGTKQKTWRAAWRAVFKAAGLPLGRANGVVWHSLRHEFCSTIAELTDNIVEVKELARHRNLQTTERYMKAREERLKALLARKAEKA